MEIHKRLKAIREDKDESQAEIAKVIGTTQQQIYKYEKGARDIMAPELRLTKNGELQKYKNCIRRSLCNFWERVIPDPPG